MALNYIKIFYDCLESIEPLDDAERGRLFTALLEYARTGEKPVLEGNERFIFPTLRLQLDRDAASYQDVCETKSRCGAMGGRPRKKADGFSESKKSKDEDKEKEEDKDKEKDSSSGAERRGRTGGPPRREKRLSRKGGTAASKGDKDLLEQMLRYRDRLRREADGLTPASPPAEGLPQTPARPPAPVPSAQGSR